MSEEANLTGEVIKQSKDVLGKAYDDLAHPTAKSIGNTISFLPRTIGIWLSKWEKWIINGEESIRLTAEAVKEKAKEIPEDKLTEPEPYVAVPAIQQLSYCYDSKELREMYANLLVASMNTDTKYQVHPSFVDIIKQLTPDEAKLLSYLSKEPIQPLLSVRHILSAQGEYVELVRHFTNISEKMCENPDGIYAYLDNLERLGLITILEGIAIKSDDLYRPLEEHALIQKYIQMPVKEKETVKIVRQKFMVTMFGSNFVETCL